MPRNVDILYNKLGWACTENQIAVGKGTTHNTQTVKWIHRRDGTTRVIFVEYDTMELKCSDVGN
jgi:hypothetical protein